MVGLGHPATIRADEMSPREQFLAFLRNQAAVLRANDQPPRTRAEWLQQRERIRASLEAAWGGFPTEHCPLEPRKIGELHRDGYRVEKLILQTMPGVWMTALAYVPGTPGKHPAILSVHGHWKHAKVEPTIQSRCIGAAKLGFFVLAVDAFGAGERGIGKALGEYHGEMVGATLFPIGRPLSGIQVYENMRCVDYLQSRPEVEPTKIGITGASGGGNQTMYAGAWDERFAAVVPVCSVGNYQAYLGPACCMCEVVPGALAFTEESGVLGMTAPRALMPCNVTRDGIQFSIREARKSVVRAQQVYDVLDQPDALYHATFHWHHDYHQPIREAMYGWMTKNLKGEGDGSPIAEPPHETENAEDLRCFPNNSRPDDWLTLPQFAGREGRRLLAERGSRLESDQQVDIAARSKTFIEKVLGGFPPKAPLEARFVGDADGNGQRLTFVSEPGITLTVRRLGEVGFERPLTANIVVLLNYGGANAAAKSPLVKSLQSKGFSVATLDMRATGELAIAGDKIGRAPDHNSAEWSLWIGRPLLGQWTWDVLRSIEALKSVRPESTKLRFHVVGEGPAGLVALCAGVVSDQIESVAAIDSLASYVTDVPYEGQPLGIMAPGILRDFGDVADLAGVSLARRVLVAGGVSSQGVTLAGDALQNHLTRCRESGAWRGAENPVVTLDQPDADKIASILLQTSR
ncbi:MAG: acetylxylan esterase [Planctomycetales bacterium 12-60-4]|nr:MAG: acetylxylan esterase [Planctomycetales bacterium 12-60-4]